MAVSESNMTELKMVVIIKLSQNEWVKIFCANGGEGNVSKFFFVQMVATIFGKCEWVWEVKPRWLNPRWPNSRWLPSSSWVRMNEFESDWISLSQSFVQNGWIKMAELKMATIIKFSQNECVKFFLCKMVECKKAEFKMAAFIKLSWNEWVWVRLN